MSFSLSSGTVIGGKSDVIVDSSTSDTAGNSSTRTIDDFLEQIYHEYKKKLPGCSGSNAVFCAEVTSSFDNENDSLREIRQMEFQALGSNHSPSMIQKGRGSFVRQWTCRSIIMKLKSLAVCRLQHHRKTCCDYRHYLPLPLLALCIANSSDATEILMLSYLLANPSFRHDMFQSRNGNGSNSVLDYMNNLQKENNNMQDDTTDSSTTTSLEGAEYLAASIFLGMLIGGTLLGFLSDQIGRRPTLLIGLLLNATAGTVSSLPFMTPTVHELTAWRFVAGVGIGATVPPLFALASEWSPKEIRGGVVTAVASFWMVGSLFVSGLAWCLFHGEVDQTNNNADGDAGNSGVSIWRIFAALCALPSALGAIMVFLYVPESPRFLASVKRDYEQSAKNVNVVAISLGIDLGDIAPTGDAYNTIQQRDEGVMHQLSTGMTPILPMTEEELRLDFLLGQSSSENTSGRNQSTFYNLCQTLKKLYSTPLVLRTTLPLKTIWFSLSFGTYGITTWINTLFVAIHLQNIYFNSFLFALANLPGNILSLVYSDQWGRKKLLVGSLVGAAGSLMVFACLVYSSSNSSASPIRTCVIVLFACGFQMFSIVSWNAIDILSGELFPTRVRSAGMGVCTSSGRLGAMFAQFVNASLMMSAAGKNDDTNSDAVASEWVLVVAASALILGAGIPFFLERDMTGGELKDEVIGTSTNGSGMGCGFCKGKKDHLSDDENDMAFNASVQDSEHGLQNNSVRGLEYQSFREEVEVNEPFLL